MGYKASVNAINKVKPILDILLRLNESSLNLDASEPTKLIYNIREALHSIEKLNYQPYLELIGKYRIIMMDNKLQFRLNDLNFNDPVTANLPYIDKTELDDYGLIDFINSLHVVPGIEYRIHSSLSNMIEWLTGQNFIVIVNPSYISISIPLSKPDSSESV